MTELERLAGCVPPLLAWHEAHRRPLPWREDQSPYRVWVSEIMLQQTRIEAVIPYFARFMERLPTVEALARVPEAELLKLWEGLGYYSRARNLQKAAREVMERWGGQLPRRAEELRQLPGIGDYTAGAIASIACGQPEPAVDGNVLRLVLRLTASREDALSPKTRARIGALLRQVYPSGREAGLLTEGLMELGETVCLPQGQLRCSLCPLAALCLGRETGQAAELPVRSEKKPRRTEARTVLLLSCGERWALRRREDRGLLAGMWEFPNLEGAWEPEALRSWLEELEAEPLDPEPLGPARHIFTHVEWHMQGWHIPCRREAAAFQWHSAAEIRSSFPIPSAFRFYLKQIP